MKTAWIIFALTFGIMGCKTTSSSMERSKRNDDPHRFWLPLDTFLRVSFLEIDEESLGGPVFAQNLHAPPLDELRRAIEKRTQLTLQAPEGSSLAILDAFETKAVLASGFSRDELHRMALEFDIQGYDFEPVCVGRGSIGTGEEGRSVYFMVVRSPAVQEFRGRLRETLINRDPGGAALLREPYEPHVTLGYTHRDLTHEDGVKKDETSCWLPVAVDEP